MYLPGFDFSSHDTWYRTALCISQTRTSTHADTRKRPQHKHPWWISSTQYYDNSQEIILLQSIAIIVLHWDEKEVYGLLSVSYGAHAFPSEHQPCVGSSEREDVYFKNIMVFLLHSHLVGPGASNYLNIIIVFFLHSPFNCSLSTALMPFFFRCRFRYRALFEIKKADLFGQIIWHFVNLFWPDLWFVSKRNLLKRRNPKV